MLLGESLDRHAESFDIPGAVLITSALVLLVLGITQGQDWGWTSASTVGVFVASAVLHLLFLAWEMRQQDPLVPFAIFRPRTLTAANVAGLVLGTALFSMVWFTQVSVGGSYWVDLLPGFLIIGLGMPFCFVPITIAALAGTREDEAGLASGLINTSQQIGGALGIAVLSTVAISTTNGAVADGTAAPQALTDGFVNAFWVGAAIALVGVLVSVLMVRGRDLAPQEQPVLEPALDTA
mgnify:CR=1 FL=1